MSRFVELELLTENVKKELKKLFNEDSTGHDLLHTLRVVKNAELLQKEHGGDAFIITLAALLHDADDKKLSPGTYKNKDNARRILCANDISEDDMERIISIINSVSFSDGKTAETIEAKIVQDADRLDALGAIGIARCFSFGGAHGRPIYNESDFIEGNIETSTSGIAHFYQKLLRLKDMMNTQYGRREAEKRTDFLEKYLTQFISEIKNEN